MIPTTVMTQLGLAAPILSAPMAGIAGGALAAAVSGAGGLGLIGGGYGDRAWLEREFDKAGTARVGVGFITWALARDPDLLALALERKPAAVMLSFGDLAAFAPAIHRAGIPLIAQVQTVEAARRAGLEGARVVVAQGTEAGGHSGQRSTMALVPAVVDALPSTPVVAAGGIADGRGLAAALMLGAGGVLCGTAFYAAKESLAHRNAKAVALTASGDDTVKGSVFDAIRGYTWPAPWSIRTLRNRFFSDWEGEVGDLARQQARHHPAFAAAQAEGDTAIAPVIVGEAVDLVRAVEPASAIVDRIFTGAKARLAAACPDGFRR